MSRLTIYKDNSVESTVVSNLFIDEYMKDANDAQLKVYLYLLRMMNAQQATSVSDIADKFNHTEKDVLRALKYWEKLALLELDYDEEKNLVGIHIHDLSIGAEARQSPSFVPVPAAAAPIHVPAAAAPVHVPAAAAPIHVPAAAAPIHVPAAAAPIHVPAAAASLQSAFPNVPQPPEAMIMSTSQPFEKPSFSADQLKEFKSRQETEQLLFIAESYIGKPLSPGEIKTILYFTDVLHFSDDLIDYLLQYCVDKGKKDFKYIEKVAVNWATEGITTPAEAEKISTRYDKNIYAIMNGLGKNNSPTAKELEYITRWTKDYAFSMDIIIEACERTVLATDKHRFEYAERILNSWKSQNVHHKSDIIKIDDMFQQRRKQPSAGATHPKQTTNRFNQFTQNSYDFDALEQELLSN